LAAGIHGLNSRNTPESIRDVTSGEPRQKVRPVCVVSSQGVKRRYDDVTLAATPSKTPKNISLPLINEN